MTQDIKFNFVDHGSSIMQPVDELNSIDEQLRDAFLEISTLDDDDDDGNGNGTDYNPKNIKFKSQKNITMNNYHHNQLNNKQQNTSHQEELQQTDKNSLESAKIIPKNSEYKVERTIPFVLEDKKIKNSLNENNKIHNNNNNNNNINNNGFDNYQQLNNNNNNNIKYPLNNFNNINRTMTTTHETTTYPSISDELKSINIHHEPSFLLLDSKEELRISSSEFFCKHLGCTMDTKLKVVSIFGNTGDGKSHTMNHIFFNGDMIFETSDEQKSCTIGVWAALQLSQNVLCLDTEGLLGATCNENHRMRMLLKILAISDIIIYRSRSERLHSDMYTFLGIASNAYRKHFFNALRSFGVLGTPQALGPAVIIFHETKNTKIIEPVDDKSTEDILRERFSEMNIDLEAFSSLKYVGIQTKNGMTNYSKIIYTISNELQNTSVRSPRTPHFIYKAINELNLKFSGKLSPQANPFPEQYFSCNLHCESCKRRCELSMGHISEGKKHFSAERCIHKHLYQNKVFLCKHCYKNGNEIIVNITTQSTNDSSIYGLVKFAWSGSVIECHNCGEIYRSRQHWYGNKIPEDDAVRTEIIHVWKDDQAINNGTTNSAQMILDSVNYVKETVCNITAQPSKVVTDWVADSMAPSYWKPNTEIIICNNCKKNFSNIGLLKHHCRGCGEGYCQPCSSHKMPVPARGWNYPVRVCDPCKVKLSHDPNACPEPIDSTEYSLNTGSSTPTTSVDEKDISARKYGEIAYNTLASVTSLLVEYPKEIIKDTARPVYWIPDDKAPHCYVCEMNFGTAEELAKNPETSQELTNGNWDRKRHHCRACGQAVCNPCSMERYPVPEHGWVNDVRICDVCVKQKYKK